MLEFFLLVGCTLIPVLFAWAYIYNRQINNDLWNFVVNDLKLQEGEFQGGWGWFHIRCEEYYPNDQKVKHTNRICREMVRLEFSDSLEIRQPRDPFLGEPSEFVCSKTGKVHLHDYRVKDNIVMASKDGVTIKTDFFRKATRNRIKWLISGRILQFIASKIPTSP